jgi:hypothetical protein
MRKNRLIHDAAYAGATVLAERMEDALRPEERKKFHRQASATITRRSIKTLYISSQYTSARVPSFRPVHWSNGWGNSRNVR